MVVTPLLHHPAACPLQPVQLCACSSSGLPRPLHPRPTLQYHLCACPQVCKIMKQDLGHEPSELFKRFERIPIASASLAQVGWSWEAGGAPCVLSRSCNDGAGAPRVLQAHLR